MARRIGANGWRMGHLSWWPPGVARRRPAQDYPLAASSSRNVLTDVGPNGGFQGRRHEVVRGALLGRWPATEAPFGAQARQPGDGRSVAAFCADRRNADQAAMCEVVVLRARPSRLRCPIPGRHSAWDDSSPGAWPVLDVGADSGEMRRAGGAMGDEPDGAVDDVLTGGDALGLAGASDEASTKGTTHMLRSTLSKVLVAPGLAVLVAGCH